MRHGGVLLVVLSACGFRSPAGAISSIDAATADAAEAATADAADNAFCDPTDAHLVACYEFEGSARDGSSHRLDATTSAVVFVGGRVGMAMQFAPTSTAWVSDSPLFDIATLTIEAWIWPSQLPAGGGRAGILDVDGQYGFFLYPGSKLGCVTSGGPTVDQGMTSIAIDHWSHVACTYDGAAAVVYVDGVEVARKTGAGMLSTSSTTGMSIAADNPSGDDRLIGLIDQVRLMDVARTAEQICADAGKPSCP